jgi:asparagine synthase (glutamine-hydrolysing)
LWNVLPKSRNNPFGNKVRQLQKYARGLREPLPERYWLWAGLQAEETSKQLLNANLHEHIDHQRFSLMKLNKLKSFSGADDFNEVLLADMQLVLPDDMLKKVDLMSMAHGLEVRVPFLDHRLVDFVFQLPVSSKINRNIRKRILQDTYRDILPPELYRRPKSGFEVPLLKWFRTSLRSLITDDLLSDRFILDQQIFDINSIQKLKRRLFSVNPGDVHAHIWALIVFQWWWKKYFR